MKEERRRGKRKSSVVIHLNTCKKVDLRMGGVALVSLKI